MLLDHEHELTEDGGLNMAAKTLDVAYYGDKPYDLGTTLRDVAIGEGPISVFYQLLGADMDDITSMTIDIINDTDGAGTSPVTLLTTGAVELASLTTALGVRRIGVIAPGLITKRYLTAKVTMTGGSSPENACKVKVFFQVGSDVAPANTGRTI
jgi:hypothetical protein